MKNIKVKDFVAILLLLSGLITEFSKNIIGIPLIILWMFLAINDNKKKFTEYFCSTKKIVILNYVWILISFFLYLVKNEFMTSYEIKNIIRIAMNLLIFGYYLYYEENHVLKIFLYISLIIITALCINTIHVLIQNPNLSRILSTGNPEKYESYISAKFIGSFGFAYGLVFVIFSIIGIKILDRKSTNRIIYVCLSLLFTITIIYEQFTISILLVVIAIIFILFKVYNIKRLIIFLTIMCCTVFIIMPTITNILHMIADSINQYEVSTRINEIISFLENFNLEKGTDMEARVNRYLMSAKTFVNDPLGLMKEKEIGGHSELLDEYAKYGIIIASFTVALFVEYIKFIKNDILKKKNNRNIWFVNGIIYLIYVTVNTSMFIITSTMVFFVVPLILKLSEKEENCENTLDS